MGGCVRLNGRCPFTKGGFGSVTAFCGRQLLKRGQIYFAGNKSVPFSRSPFLAFSCRFRTRISRSSVQKRSFHPSVFERFGQADFFNTVDR
jgi:hypothetical protein